MSIAIVLNVVFSVAQVASAATFNVNSTGDAADTIPGDGACSDGSGACTLRAAIQEANALSGNDTLAISVTGTINLTGALPIIGSNMTINGPGSGLLTVRRDTGGDYRIFFTNNVNVNISGLTITNGRAPDSSVTGGGIWQGGGSMTLTDVVITGNRTGDGFRGSGDSSGGMGGSGGGIAGSGILTLTNVVVSNNATGNGGTGYYGGSGGFGGGISFSGNTLTMTNVVVSGNTTGNAGETTGGGYGGHGGNGGGIYAGTGILNLSNVTVRDNIAGDGDDGGHGGGMYLLPNATTTMRDCTISNNSSGMGGSKQGAQGGYGGGIVNHGETIMIGCLISGNSTKRSGFGAGGGSLGGGIFNGNTLKMINCTVSGNKADPLVGRGGGIFNNANALTLTNVTMTGNSAYSGENCCWFQHGQGMHNSGVANVRNSIIAGNGKATYEPNKPASDVTGLYNSQGNNIIGRAQTGSIGDTSQYQVGFTHGVNSDQVGTPEAPINPQLGPLASNGGPTQTHALLAGSPALDKGNNSLAVDANNNPLTTDQRGSGRFADSNGTSAGAIVDIGSFEFHTFLEDVADQVLREDNQLFVPFNIGDADLNPSSITATSDNQALIPDDNLSVTGTGPIRTLGITLG
ncbi:MAG TPA: choice-of-anchor Q domain-containing protein, partial [Pyrinomonadaceae bacterium]